MKIRGTVIQILVLVSVLRLYASDELQKIQEAIKTQGASWQAGENWVTRLTPAERKRLLGARRDFPLAKSARLLQLPRPKSMPNHFDWRDNGGNWVTPVRNQGNCGSCWDFSAVAQIESWWKIHYVRPESMLDLSEQFILSCHNNGGCDGDWVETVLDFATTYGLPSEACFPYYASDTIPCSRGCPDWQSQATTIPGWGYITLEEDIIDNIKAALMIHPVSATYTVYSDFYYYTGGVYEHLSGTEEGGHAILIVGWDDAERSWICKNSWGADWGENGYFRIRWSNCGMGTYMPFIYEEILNTPALAYAPAEINVALEVGDTAEVPIVVKNNGNGLLQFASIDNQMVIAFHPDNFESYDGSSWWCGSRAIGGYADHWLQYLETPMLDLSTTSNPVLTWQGKWALEDPAGAPAPYDGWDGCNVWISVNGGETFQVIRPVSPAYNCQYLWSFSNPDEGWNLGANIPGWGGSSNGWQSVTFDLSSYRQDSVIIRWAMASDMGYSTANNAALTGFFVDQIRLTDGAQVIFSNNGDNWDGIRTLGFGSGTAEWLTLLNGAGSLQPGDSAIVIAKIKTHFLEPGDYHANINFLSNDQTNTNAQTQCHLSLAPAQHDIAIDEFWTPGANLPLLVKADIGARLSNRGQNPEINFKVICRANDGNQIVYQDTVAVPYLAIGASQVIKFKPLLFTDAHALQMTIFLTDLQADRNVFNNALTTTLNATNAVDGFEEDLEFWAYEGGWAPTTAIDHHSGNMAAHNYGGNKPYPNNMDARLTFRPCFHIKNIEYAYLAFWSIFQIEQDRDFCFVELSTDSTNWNVAMTLTGTQSKWKMYKVDLSSVLGKGAEKCWVRFHFTSDAANGATGILIDDVAIYLGPLTGISIPNEVTSLPSTYSLEQNYPNPFNPQTFIKYQLPVDAFVTLKLFNYRGELVRVLVNAYQSAGYHRITLDVTDLPSGVYFYQITAGNYRAARKCLLIK